ncbi:predicted protein, partial [Nematostella vectensis]
MADERATSTTETQKKTRLDWRKEKELEEARKAGTAPALQDEEGRDINPHIPQYISAAPWYYGKTGPTLKHQRPQPEKTKEVAPLNEWYKRGIPNIKAPLKFRKGACENCGAMTHKKRDCLERPRRVGARFTGDDIRPDEYIQKDLSLDYDSKRDRSYSYYVNKLYVITFSEIIYLSAIQLSLLALLLFYTLASNKCSKKYLYNLDINSAYYDPKTRSMRENPLTDKDRSSLVTYSGDNFVRYSGDTSKMAQTQ